MKNTVFTGSAVAIITPFNENGVNFDELGRIIEFHIENKTDAIVICGTTGEASTMPDDEHLSAIKYCVEKVAGRIPVIAGTGSNDTIHAIKLSKKSEEYGADAILTVTPYYNKATQKGLYEHFSAIANSIDIPVILYNVPSRTGCNIKPETLVKLSEIPNIVAVKEASGDLSQVAKIASLLDGKMDIYSGNDDQILPVLSLGGKGVISVLANVMPNETHDMVEKFLNGDIEGAKKLQLDTIELIDALFCEVNPIPVKTAMNLMGFNAGKLRLPLSEMEEGNLNTLKKALKNQGLIK